jgi:hypothetical protein
MAERIVLLIDLLTFETRPMAVADAAAHAQLLQEEVAWALNELSKCATDRHLIVEIDGELPSTHRSGNCLNACFLLEVADRPIGYFRRRDNAVSKAHEIAGIQIVELSPPERIACEDDPADAN